MPRKEKKYHFIYKTTCKVTRRFYVGMHSTNDLDDSYLGSGKRLKYSVRKHGPENHEREILEFLPDRQGLKEREAEIITEQFLEDPDCMNITTGGKGGWDYVNQVRSKESRIKAAIKGGKNAMKRHGHNITNLIKNNPDFKRKHSERAKIIFNKGTRFLGRTHSEETKEKMRESAKGKHFGEKNSQFGTCWVCNDEGSKKIRKEYLDRHQKEGWRRGRK